MSTKQMKKWATKRIAQVLGLVGLMAMGLIFGSVLTGCGGGGGSNPVAVQSNTTETMITGLSIAAEGTHYDDTFSSYEYRQIQLSSDGMIPETKFGAFVYGVEAGGRVAKGGGGTMPGAIVEFIVYDGSTIIGERQIVAADQNGLAEVTINFDPLVVPSGSSKRICVEVRPISTPEQAVMKDVVSVLMTAEFLAADLALSYEVEVSGQDDPVTIPVQSYALLSVSLKNTGNAVWTNFVNRLDRLYLTAAQGTEIFYDERMWYSGAVVDDLGTWGSKGSVLPGQSIDVSFYLATTGASSRGSISPVSGSIPSRNGSILRARGRAITSSSTPSKSREEISASTWRSQPPPLPRRGSNKVEVLLKTRVRASGPLFLFNTDYGEYP